MKRFTSLLMALTMVFTLGVTAHAAKEPAAAAPAFSITINNDKPGHTYEAYQIFAAKLFENEKQEKVLSDIKWGNGVTPDAETAFGNAADKAETIATADKAQKFADELEAYLNPANAKPSTFANGKYTISGLEAGYYLIKDQDNSVSEHDAYTSYIMQVVGNAEVKPKSDVPVVEKKVKDINDSTGVETGWQDSADYDIGDNVPFQLTATLADNVSSYDAYKIIFHDTLSAGLTFNNDAKVKFNGTDVTANFTISYDPDRNTLTISCDNVMAFHATDSSVITVEYTAKLNDKAVVGAAGNPNQVSLEYSNNPNPAGSGNVGNTPVDKVVVFTYETVVHKTNEKGQPLEGAGFTLFKQDQNGDFQQVGQELKGDKMTIFTWKGLDDGVYKLVETTTPDGYNTMEPITFTITAEHDITADDPALTSLTGGNPFTGDNTSGKLEAAVENHPGFVLPGTGGIGTTVFYVAGGAMILLAGVLLFIKKRNSDNA